MTEKDDLDFDVELGGSTDTDNQAKASGKGGSAKGSVAEEEALAKEQLERKMTYPKFLKDAAHPGFCLTHLAFKIAGLAFYILLSLFTSDGTLVFIFTVIMSVFDFWVTKNLTGR